MKGSSRRQEATGFAVQGRNSRPTGTRAQIEFEQMQREQEVSACMSSSNVGVLYYSGVPCIWESVILVWKRLEEDKLNS